jgi:hypothetical protein
LMFSGIVLCAISPGFPDDTDPSTAENAGGLRVVAAARSGALVDLGGPSRAVTRVIGKAGDGDVRLHAQPKDNRARFADGMGDAGPIQSRLISHLSDPPGCERLARAGRSCGSLIDGRSGRQPLARHPVIRPNFPAPAVRRVSRGPSGGKRPWAGTRAGTRYADTRPLHAPARRCTNEQPGQRVRGR